MTEPSETSKGLGAALGAGGGAVVGVILTFIMFALFSSPCDCFLASKCGDCMWGKTMSEYWASYGAGISLAFVAMGALVGGSV